MTFHSCVSFLREHLAHQIERHIFKNPDVNSPFLSHRLSTECALDVGGSSWRRAVEGGWFSEYVQRDRKESYYDKILQSLSEI